jgi:hypothetical protein
MGVVQKISRLYSLKMKEMIMTGILSEGSVAVADPRYEAR